MSNDVLIPPAHVIESFPVIQKDIEADTSGNKTRQLLDFFDDAALKCREMQVQCAEHSDKEWARLMCDGFISAKQIVTLTWEKAHHTVTPGSK